MLTTQSRRSLSTPKRLLPARRLVQPLWWSCALVFIGLIGCADGSAQQDGRGVVPAAGETAPRRVALVIGNADYPGQPLHNPVNDANDVGTLLSRTLGFETEIVRNADRQTFESAVHRFVAKLSPGDVGLFYFSGHGLEVDGENYLLPVNFAADSQAEVKYRSFPANEILDLMRDHGVRLSILILDACRNNPYRSWKGVGGGLATMSGEGAFIAFAAGAGKTADDNPGERNGLFTKYLLQVLPEPGLKIGDVFDLVREGVYQASHGKQMPFSYSGVIGNFFFRFRKTETVAGTAGASETASPLLGARSDDIPASGASSAHDESKLQLSHFTLRGIHAGTLAGASGRVSWTETGAGAKKDNFSVPCADILDVGQYYIHVQLGSKQKGYSFMRTESSTNSDSATRVKRVKKGSLALDIPELERTILGACPGGFGPKTDIK